MPEIAEVARLVHFLRLHVVGRRIASVTAPDDPVLFGKAGTTGAAFEAAARGKMVMSAGSQGKYFWITFNTSPHLVMHLGMSGWIHIRGEKTAYTNYYKKMKPGDDALWPPRYWKWQLETEATATAPGVQVAYTDPRRFGRVRVVDCPGAEIRAHPPLSENGPDPVVDAAVFTEEFLRERMRARHVPVKALLLDQTTISGIGNWVADEVLFQARLHPEQYCDDFDDDEVARLHSKIVEVCTTAVAKLGDSDQFPGSWLFNHRWGKGKDSGGKGAVLPNGEKLAFITVGGRTSCYAPALQKKTGKLVAEVEGKSGDEAGASKKGGKAAVGSKRVKKEETDEGEGEKEPRPTKRAKKPAADGPRKATTKADIQEDRGEPTGRRRSARLCKRG